VRLFDDADHAAIAGGAGAVEAGIGIGDVIADAAFANLQFGIANGIGQRDRFFRTGAQDMKGKPLSRLLTDSGQAFEFIDKPSDGFGKVRHQRSPVGVRKLSRSMVSRETVRTIRGFSSLRFQETRWRAPSFGKPIPHQRDGMPR